MQNSVCSQRLLDPLFLELQKVQNSSLYYFNFYFGSVDGTFRFYPGVVSSLPMTSSPLQRTFRHCKFGLWDERSHQILIAHWGRDLCLQEVKNCYGFDPRIRPWWVIDHQYSLEEHLRTFVGVDDRIASSGDDNEAFGLCFPSIHKIRLDSVSSY